MWGQGKPRVCLGLLLGQRQRQRTELKTELKPELKPWSGNAVETTQNLDATYQVCTQNETADPQL
jgi:hypothetical protein